MKLEKIFNLTTFTYSETATRKGISNATMTNVQLCNLIALHQLLLDIQAALCLKFNTLVTINLNSAFRSVELNDYFVRTIGASKTSQHMSGQAADTFVTGITFDQYFDALKDFAKGGKFTFGQVIKEYGAHPDRSTDDWIHISLNTLSLKNDFMIKEHKKGYVKVKL